MATKRKHNTKPAPCEYQLSIGELLDKVKANLILQHSQDDKMLEGIILDAIHYAESRQHYPEGYYQTNRMRRNTERAVIILATHLYESRDGSTGGFFNDKLGAADKTEALVDKMLRLNKRNWGF